MKIQNNITREGEILMKQLKRISRLKIQSSTIKEGKTWMKLKRVSKIKIQRNTRKEGKTLMKQSKKISKMKIPSNITREGKILMKQLKRISRLKKQHQKRRTNRKMEREKAFEEVQGLSMVDCSFLDTAAYGIIEDDCLKEATVVPE